MSDHRIPYVGDGPDGCRRSAQMDRTEADGLDLLDPRIDELLASADRWEAQAADLEAAPLPELAAEIRKAVKLVEDDPQYEPILAGAILDPSVPPGVVEVRDDNGTVLAQVPTDDAVFLLPAPRGENTRTVVSKRGHLAMADALYARGRRDTPTGTVIARLDPLSDRANWLAVRRTGIGSSDVPILLGLSTGEYAKSELDLYMDKRGEVPDDESGEAALWGTLLEDPVAREWAKRETQRLRENRGPEPGVIGVTVQRVGTIAHREHRHMLCDLDRRVIGCPDHDRCALEVKTRSAYKAADWSDGVPEDTLSQVMHQLAVTGYDAIHVAALIGGQKLVTYVVEPDADMIADLFAIEDQFWRENVLAGVPPEISSLDLLVDHLKHFTPVKGEVVRVHGADAAEVRYLTDKIDTAKTWADAQDEAEKRLKALIGEDATDLLVVDDDGNEEPMWTWRPQNKPKQLDKPAVEAVLGAPLDSFKVSTGTTRVLRRVKPRGA
jgi:putative phage-type endonuclease